jgi:hypothetical protein
MSHLTDDESSSGAPTPRVAVDTIDDWARVRASYASAARSALDARLAALQAARGGKGPSEEERERLVRGVEEVCAPL